MTVHVTRKANYQLLLKISGQQQPLLPKVVLTPKQFFSSQTQHNVCALPHEVFWSVLSTFDTGEGYRKGGDLNGENASMSSSCRHFLGWWAGEGPTHCASLG